ncbi:MAG: Sbal_3080 family lipoprotein [Pseudomonadota bacterium]
MRLSHNQLNFGVLVLIGSFALGGCTSVRVQPVSAEHKITHVCISDNPRVMVGDFVDVMREGFQKYGITSQVITGSMAPGCPFTSEYTARRTWDLAMYMTDAQIDILRDGRQIATANYHLKGGGGFSLNKWANTRTKILPVMDQVLAQVVRPSGPSIATANPDVPVSLNESSARAADPAPTSELTRKLSDLKDAFDVGLITREEYESKRKDLITNL